MPDRISRARLSTDPALLQDQARLLLSTSLGGLTLLRRQLLTLHAVGIGRVDLCVPEADQGWMTAAVAAAPPVAEVEVNVVAETPGDSRPGPTLVIPADLIIDVRALRQLVASVDGTGPVICVDRAPAQYDVDLKSPYIVGAPGGFDGRLLSTDAGDAGGFQPIGVTITTPRTQPPAYFDIGRYYWHRIRTDSDNAVAVRKILLATMKPTDGIYARTNRRISLRLSRRLLDTPVTANAVTLFTLALSIVAGIVMANGSYAALLSGAVLAWVASMLDGVDGEIARAKFQSSDFGHWLEMVCDYAFYVAVAAGHGVGLYRQTGQQVWLDIGIATSVGVIISFFVIAWMKRRYEQREPEGEYYVALQRTVGTHAANPFYRVLRTCNVLVTRAAFPYYVVLFSLLALTKVVFVMMAIGANVSWMLAAYASRLSFTMTPPPAPVPIAEHRYPMRARTADEG